MIKENTTVEDITKGKYVVKFWSPGCMPCKALSPIFEKLATDRQFSAVTFASVDISQESGRNLAGKFRVRSVPTVLFMDNGQCNDILTGETAANERKIKNLLLDLMD